MRTVSLLATLTFITACSSSYTVTAQNGEWIMLEGTSVTERLQAEVTPDAPIFFELLSQPEHGIAVLSDNKVTYTPFPNWSGEDWFAFEALAQPYDAVAPAAWSEGTIIITVEHRNDPPEASNDLATTPQGTAVIIDVLANDVDPEGDALTVEIETQPSNGTVSVQSDQTVLYTPNSDFIGNDTFEYQVLDGEAGDVGLVTIAVDVPVGVCTTEDAILEIEGLEIEGLGEAVWNSTGGLEPAAEGHDLGFIDSQYAGTKAYYYLATRDHVDDSAVAGALATSIDRMPATVSALDAGGYTIDQITAKHGLLSLGDDIEGLDWAWSAPVETRWYRGSTTFDLELGGETLVSAPLDEVTMTINYETNELSAEFGPLQFVDASTKSSPAVRDVAAAILDDLAEATGVRFSLDTMQNAFQTDFEAEGRLGSYYNINDTFAEPECP